MIGTGTMAERIALAIAGDPGSRLGVVVGRTKDGAEGFAARHDCGVGTADLERALADDVDLVYVGSPNELHAEHARRALEAGKHVLCDKPVGTSLVDAQGLVRLAAERNLRLGANYQNRHHPALHRVRGWLEEGAVGRPVLLRASIAFGPEELVGWRAQDELAGAAALYNLGVHAIDTLLAVAGEPVSDVFAMSSPTGTRLDRTDVISLRFASGALGTVLASQELADDEVRIEMVGTHGRITWDGWMSPYRTGSLALDRPTEERVIEPSAAPRAYELLVEDFADAVRTGRDPLPSGVQIVETVAVTEAARESAGRGTVVKV